MGNPFNDSMICVQCLRGLGQGRHEAYQTPWTGMKQVWCAAHGQGWQGEVEQGVPRIPNSMVTCLMHLFTCQWIILLVTIETSLNWKHTETQNSEFVKVQMFDKLNHTYFYYTMWGESSLNKKTKASWLTCWGCPAIETPHCLPPSRKVHSSSIP